MKTKITAGNLDMLPYGTVIQKGTKLYFKSLRSADSIFMDTEGVYWTVEELERMWKRNRIFVVFLP